MPPTLKKVLPNYKDRYITIFHIFVRYMYNHCNQKNSLKVIYSNNKDDKH